MTIVDLTECPKKSRYHHDITNATIEIMRELEPSKQFHHACRYFADKDEYRLRVHHVPSGFAASSEIPVSATLDEDALRGIVDDAIDTVHAEASHLIEHEPYEPRADIAALLSLVDLRITSRVKKTGEAVYFLSRNGIWGIILDPDMLDAPLEKWQALIQKEMQKRDPPPDPAESP